MKAKLLILFLCAVSHYLFAQQERGYVRKGNQKYIEGKLDEAEKEYNKALDVKNTLTEGVFNLGDVAYKKKEYEKATKQFETAAMLAKDKQVKAKAYHNLGNTYLDAGQYDKSVEAYKNALRLNPSDLDTKYNLAYAQRMLKKNPQQNQQNKDKNQDKNQDKKDQNEQNKQDQQSQNQQDQQANQDKKEGEQKEQQQQQAQEQQAKEEHAQQQQAQPKEGQISKEDAQRLLEALMQQEQKVQQQIVNKKMPPAEKKKVDKDW